VDNVHDDGGTKAGLLEKAAVTRKDLLRRAGVGAGAVVLGSALAAVPANAARMAIPMVNLGRRTFYVGYGGATCEAFTYAAYAKGLFAREGIDVKLHHGALGVSGVDALHAGTVDAAPGNFYGFLKPIEQGADIKLTAGLHGGCLRLVVGPKSGIKTYADLKGKTIGTNGIKNQPNAFFAVALAKAGVDPIKDVQWRTYLPAQFGPALAAGEIQAVAGIDPAPFVLVQQGKAVQIGSNMTGMFANLYCCSVVLNGALVRNDPKAAAALTRALMNGSIYTGQHIHEVATIEATNKYVVVTESTAEHLLASYTWKPSATLIKGDLEQGARDFKMTGILSKKTDPAALARTAYVDIFKLAGEAP
jgi:NitT/TauT family transport system substrate-binding protein